jgi:hypothetical protein
LKSISTAIWWAEASSLGAARAPPAAGRCRRNPTHSSSPWLCSYLLGTHRKPTPLLAGLRFREMAHTPEHACHSTHFFSACIRDQVGGGRGGLFSLPGHSQTRGPGLIFHALEAQPNQLPKFRVREQNGSFPVLHSPVRTLRKPLDTALNKEGRTPRKPEVGATLASCTL